MMCAILKRANAAAFIYCVIVLGSVATAFIVYGRMMEVGYCCRSMRGLKWNKQEMLLFSCLATELEARYMYMLSLGKVKG